MVIGHGQNLPRDNAEEEGKETSVRTVSVPQNEEKERSHCILSSLPGRKQDAVQRKKSKLEK